MHIHVAYSLTCSLPICCSPPEPEMLQGALFLNLADRRQSPPSCSSPPASTPVFLHLVLIQGLSGLHSHQNHPGACCTMATRGPLSGAEVQPDYLQRCSLIICISRKLQSFPGGSDGKVSACNPGDPSSIPETGRAAEEGNGNPLQYGEFHVQKSLYTVHGVAKSQTWLRDELFHFYLQAPRWYWSLGQALSSTDLVQNNSPLDLQDEAAPIAS